MFVADRGNEVLHVPIALVRVGTWHLQVATGLRFIDPLKLLTGFVVVEQLRHQNHLTGFGIEKIAVLERRILHCEPKLLEVHLDRTSGLLVLHLGISCITSHKAGSAPHSTRFETSMPLTGSSRRVRTNASAKPGGSLFPPRVARVFDISHHRRNRRTTAAPDPPASCSAAGRSDASWMLTATRPARWKPSNCSNTAKCSTGPGGGALRISAIPASILERTSSARRGLLRTKSPTDMPMISSIHAAIPSG